MRHLGYLTLAPALLLQVLMSPAALEALEQVPAVTDLLSYILVRGLAQRPSAGDVCGRCALARQEFSPMHKLLTMRIINEIENFRM